MARPRSFEKGDVLNTAMNLFWIQGYSDTAISDIAEQAELKPGSLYNTFKNKDKLFEEAIEYYVETVIAPRLKNLQGVEPIDQRIRNFLEDVAAQSMQPNRIPGCFLTNSALEGYGLPDDKIELLEQKIIDLEDAFARTFREAKENGELTDGTRPRRLARFLVGMIQGMNVLGRSVPERERMDDLIESTMETIRNHRKGDQS